MGEQGSWEPKGLAGTSSMGTLGLVIGKISVSLLCHQYYLVGELGKGCVNGSLSWLLISNQYVLLVISPKIS